MPLLPEEPPGFEPSASSAVASEPAAPTPAAPEPAAPVPAAPGPVAPSEPASRPADDVVVAELADHPVAFEHAEEEHEPDRPSRWSVGGLTVGVLALVAIVVVGGIWVARSFATEDDTREVLAAYAAGERGVTVEADDAAFAADFPSEPDRVVREGRDARGAYPVHELRAPAGPSAEFSATWFELTPDGLTPGAVERLLRSNAQYQADELGGALASSRIAQLGLLVVHDYEIHVERDAGPYLVVGRSTVVGTRFRAFTLAAPEVEEARDAYERFAASIELR